MELGSTAVISSAAGGAPALRHSAASTGARRSGIRRASRLAGALAASRCVGDQAELAAFFARSISWRSRSASSPPNRVTRLGGRCGLERECAGASPSPGGGALRRDVAPVGWLESRTDSSMQSAAQDGCAPALVTTPAWPGRSWRRHAATFATTPKAGASMNSGICRRTEPRDDGAHARRVLAPRDELERAGRVHGRMLIVRHTGRSGVCWRCRGVGRSLGSLGSARSLSAGAATLGKCRGTNPRRARTVPGGTEPFAAWCPCAWSTMFRVEPGATGSGWIRGRIRVDRHATTRERLWVSLGCARGSGWIRRIRVKAVVPMRVRALARVN